MFDNVSKLIGLVKSSGFFNKIKPGNSEIEVPQSVVTDITNGAYLCIAYSAITSVSTIFSRYRTGFFSEIISFAIGAAIAYAIMMWLTGQLGEPKRKAGIYYILAMLGLLALVLGTLGLLSTALWFLSWSFIAGIIYLIAIPIYLLGIVNLTVGCVDFCLEANKE